MEYKGERIVLRVLDSDKTALRRLAKAEGEAMSVIVRRLIRDAARQYGLWPPKEQVLDQQDQGQETGDGPQ